MLLRISFKSPKNFSLKEAFNNHKQLYLFFFVKIVVLIVDNQIFSAMYKGKTEIHYYL